MAQHRNHFSHDKAIRFDVGVRRPQASIQVRPIEQLIGFVASVAPIQIHFIFECKFERHEPFIFEGKDFTRAHRALHFVKEMFVARSLLFLMEKIARRVAIPFCFVAGKWHHPIVF